MGRERILQPQSYSDMWSVQVHEANDAASSDSALGWWVRHNHTEIIVEHEGGDDGFVSHFCLWPQRQLSMVVLCNAVWAEPWKVTEEVYRLMKGQHTTQT